MCAASKIAVESEEWFLTNIQRHDVPIESFLTVLERLHKAGHAEKFEACAELLQESLIERRDRDAALKLLTARAAWCPDDKKSISICKKVLASVFSDMPTVLQCIPHAGFETGAKAAECLRRFEVMRKLEPGTLCYNETWGFGTVRETDWFLARIVVDFKTKAGHGMSLAYASESLKLIGNEHILAEQHRNPEEFARRVEHDPGGVVKAFLRDFGPMNVTSLRERMQSCLDAVNEWKPFWDNARKQLKNDPLVVIPAKRSDPIRSLDTKVSMDNHWITLLRDEEDPVRFLGLIEELKDQDKEGCIPDAVRNAISERISMLIMDTAGNSHAAVAHALLLADELELERDPEQESAVVDRLLDPATLLNTARHLPSRIFSRLTSFLMRSRPVEAQTRLLELVPELPLARLNILIDSLLALGHEAAVADKLRDSITARGTHINLVGWLCTHLDFTFRNNVCDPDRLAFIALSALDAGDITGEHLQARNTLRGCFRKNEWLKNVVEPQDDLQRQDLILRLKISSAWSESERHMLMARLAQLFPKLRGKIYDAPAATKTRRVTSHRSYAERQSILQNLISRDIPRNIKDIAAARSFGDLSENYEYHAARETQRMLMARRKELEDMLREVTGTAFENASCDKAGMGTCVTLRHEDGSMARYVILGEWDNDERLGIISSSSGLAQILAGHKTGDEVMIPDEAGHTRCTIAGISELPDEIRAWIQG